MRTLAMNEIGFISGGTGTTPPPNTPQTTGSRAGGFTTVFARTALCSSGGPVSAAACGVAAGYLGDKVLDGVVTTVWNWLNTPSHNGPTDATPENGPSCNGSTGGHCQER
jgi:hypothetical protein